MAKWVGPAGVVLVGIGLAVVVSRDPGQFSLVDPDCPPEAPDFLVEDDRGLQDAGTDIAAYELGDRQPRRITDDHSSLDPDLSPDGTQIAFARGFGFNSEYGYNSRRVYVMSASGEGARPLTKGDTGDPDWSPDGDKILFAGRPLKGAPTGVYFVEADGGVPHLLVTPAKGSVYSPRWSPDADRFAFVKSSGRKEEVWVADIDGTNLRLIAAGDSFFPLEWSADGEHLAWSAYEESNRIYIADVDSGEVEIFDKSGELISWSHSGRHLIYSAYFGSGRYDLVSRELGSSDEVPIKGLPFGDSGYFKLAMC